MSFNKYLMNSWIIYLFVSIILVFHTACFHISLLKDTLGYCKFPPQLVLLWGRMKFIKSGNSGDVGWQFFRMAGQSVLLTATCSADSHWKYCKVSLLFYIQFLSKSLVSFICIYCTEFVFNFSFRHILLCYNLLKSSVSMARLLDLSF